MFIDSISPFISDRLSDISFLFVSNSSVLSWVSSIILSTFLITAIRTVIPAIAAPTGLAFIAAPKPLKDALNLPTSGTADLYASLSSCIEPVVFLKAPFNI